tara:strand:- start:493 stop:990 length:498 start_codon:yes stop_codon:yes gene_type:complete
MSAKLPLEIIRVANAEVGVEEVDGSNSGKRVMEYQAATSLGGTGWPWCSAFVCFVVREAMKNCGIKETATFRRPTTASAYAMKLWSLAQDATTSTKSPHRGDIAPGDIIIFTFSHIGFAASKPDTNGYVTTYEGNTNGAGSREGGAVLRKKRHVSKIKTRIRFTV